MNTALQVMIIINIVVVVGVLWHYSAAFKSALNALEVFRSLCFSTQDLLNKNMNLLDQSMDMVINDGVHDDIAFLHKAVKLIEKDLNKRFKIESFIMNKHNNLEYTVRVFENGEDIENLLTYYVMINLHDHSVNIERG